MIGKGQIQRNAAVVWPWHRAKAMVALGDAEFLTYEPWLRPVDGFWDYLCDQERRRRGMDRYERYPGHNARSGH